MKIFLVALAHCTLALQYPAVLQQRSMQPIMKTVNRREVLQGKGTAVGDWLHVVRTDFKNSGFVDLAVPLAGIGWAITQRGDTAATLAAMESQVPDNKMQAPRIAVTAARVTGKVQVEVIGPSLDGEIVDYLWLRDADTGALIGSKALKTNGGLPGSKGDPTYAGLVECGRRIVAFVHCSSSGL